MTKIDKRHPNGKPTQAEVIGKNSEFDAAVDAIVKADSDLKARIVQSAQDLNYWGKRLASAKMAVIEQVAEIFKDYAINLDSVKSIIEAATPAKKEKIASEKKEKAPDNRPVSSGTLSHVEFTRPVIFGKKFLVTSAQNNTPVHAPFLDNLKKYAELIGAKILAFPCIYNHNAFQNGEGSDDIWYDPMIVAYLQKESVWLGDGNKVSAMAYNILPTAKNPLSGMKEALGSAEAMIIPHATVAHECVAVLGAQFGRVVPQMFATGAVTQKNYINQAAGNRASNRHCFAATLVEFDDNGQFWVRQIETDESGNFQDLRTYVSESGFEDCDIETVSYGDIHAEKSDANVASVNWGFGNSVLNFLKPKLQFCHDLLDFEALNHHSRDEKFHKAKNYFQARTVALDLRDVAGILNTMYRPFCQTVIVRSNHDGALDSWLSCNKYNSANDPANALTYHKLQVAAYTCMQSGKFFDSLPTALNQETDFDTSKARFLRSSESVVVRGVEHGEHGHYGSNGARGAKGTHSATKATTGHTHSSSITGGQYVGGVSGRLAMGYNESGPSSWVHANVIQYKTGFRSIIHVKPCNGGLDFMAR